VRGAKSGGHGPALLPPFLAIAQKQAAAKHRAQHTDRPWAAPIVPGVFDQDVADRLGGLQKQVIAAEKALNDDIFGESSFGERRQGIAAQGRRDSAPRQPAWRSRSGRLVNGQRLHFHCPRMARQGLGRVAAPRVLQWIYAGIIRPVPDWFRGREI
jgi:hypothetical protein